MRYEKVLEECGRRISLPMPRGRPANRTPFIENMLEYIILSGIMNPFIHSFTYITDPGCFLLDRI